MALTSLVPVPGGAGALYAISADDWAAIAARVAQVIGTEDIAAQIQVYIPNYVSLLAATKAWQADLAKIIAQAVYVGIFAGDMVNALTALAGDLKGLTPADPVPAGIAFLFKVKFGAAARSAATIDQGLAPLAPDVDAFVAQNKTADAAIEKIIAELPPDWKTIGGPLTLLDGAFTLVQQGWGGLAAQLTTLSGDHPGITTAALLAADLTAINKAWTDLGNAAAAFASHAKPSAL